MRWMLFVFLFISSGSVSADEFEEELRFLQTGWLPGALVIEQDVGEAPLTEKSKTSDPFEKLNRITFKFNRKLDRRVVKPVVKRIVEAMPEPVNQAVHNFFGNLGDVSTGINNLLQGKFNMALQDTGRVVVNSTVGLLGLVDIASQTGTPKNKEDFGQTLGKWGLGTGPYIVLPVLGPSNLRDTTGLAVDTAYLDPVAYVEDDATAVVLGVTRLLKNRDAAMGVTNLLDEGAIDPYIMMRDAYTQKRDYDVKDGDIEDEDF